MQTINHPFGLTPKSGVRIGIDRSTFTPRTSPANERPLSIQLGEIDALSTRIRERLAHYYLVIGFLLGGVLGFSIALAIVRISGDL